MIVSELVEMRVQEYGLPQYEKTSASNSCFCLDWCCPSKVMPEDHKLLTVSKNKLEQAFKNEVKEVGALLVNNSVKEIRENWEGEKKKF